VAFRGDAVTADESEKQDMTAAIYFHPEAYTTSGPKLMGRNAAGESFLRGFFAYSKAQEFWAQVQTPEYGQAFAATAQNAGRRELVKLVDKNSLGALAQVGAVYFPGPGLGEHAWQRAVFGHGAWSLCGITHTTSSARAMDALAELLVAPVQPWDALICTSAAVKSNVTRLLQAQVDYLGQRLGIQKLVLPELPVIPLGIHTQDFSFTAAQKGMARAAIGADEHTLVVLYMGRLSFHAKAHPLAMYQALERAAAILPAKQKVVLVECGWHANEFIEKAFTDAAKLACPSVRVVTLDGRKAEDRRTAWACADVFCSLSDNIQETFGIVPIEAMAAGLPVVVSDWDGYKDTVRDGVDGFRVSTLVPGAGLAGDLALRHALEIDTYDMYCGHTCSLVAVDVEAAARAFMRLFASQELRKTMGDMGQQRAREQYDWSVIIPQYEALWAQLADIRHAQAKDLKALLQPWPARMDPFHAFAGYSTRPPLMARYPLRPCSVWWMSMCKQPLCVWPTTGNWRWSILPRWCCRVRAKCRPCLMPLNPVPYLQLTWFKLSLNKGRFLCSVRSLG
jgi:glycosyltransferase involved in cell wall biosynthesis